VSRLDKIAWVPNWPRTGPPKFAYAAFFLGFSESKTCFAGGRRVRKGIGPRGPGQSGRGADAARHQ